METGDILSKNDRLVEQENREALINLAIEQGGYFTSGQAVDTGFADSNHARNVASGQWVRVARGIYQLSMIEPTDRPDIILATLWSRGRDGVPGVVSHISAAALWDLGEFTPNRLDLSVPANFSHRSKSPVAVELHLQDLPSRDVSFREGGFRVTSPLRTVTDLMCDDRVDQRSLDVALLDAIGRGLISRTEISERLAPDVVATKTRMNIKTAEEVLFCCFNDYLLEPTGFYLVAQTVQKTT